MLAATSYRRAGAGFTLIEVLIALAITGLIAVISHQAFVTAADSNEQSEQILADLDELGRTWQRLASDFRNMVLVQSVVDANGAAVAALTTEPEGDYVVWLVRGGRANLQNLPRSNLQRVGYRLVDGVLWRDVWEQGFSIEDTKPVAVDLLHGVKRIEWRFLPANAATVEASGWVNQWPINEYRGNALPLGVEIILEGESFGEIRRVFSVLPGTNG